MIQNKIKTLLNSLINRLKKVVNISKDMKGFQLINQIDLPKLKVENAIPSYLKEMIIVLQNKIHKYKAKKNLLNREKI